MEMPESSQKNASSEKREQPVTEKKQTKKKRAAKETKDALTKQVTFKTKKPSSKSEDSFETQNSKEQNLGMEDFSITTSNKDASNKILKNSRYRIGLKFGLCFFSTQLEQIGSNQPGISTGFANLFGITQSLAFSPVTLNLDLNFLVPRFSHPSNATQTNKKGLNGSGVNVQFGPQYEFKGKQTFIGAHVGSLQFQLNKNNDASTSSPEYKLSSNSFPYIALNTGAKLQDHFIIDALLGQYLDVLPGSSFSQVSFSYLF
jgi:hypothetical protein